MKYAADYRAMARNMLKGFWVITAAITLLASILGGVSYGSSAGSSSSDSGISFEWPEEEIAEKWGKQYAKLK